MAGSPVSRAVPRGIVLVADDDPVMRMLMLEMLSQVGLDGIEAADGAQALALAQAHAPDLVLLDVDMPNIDGFAACRAIRQLEHGAMVPIIMVTGGDDIDAVTSAYEAGATDFVSKPINWPILGHRVLYVLRASDAIVRLRIADAQNRAVLAAIPDTFFRMNKDGVYLDYAPGHERALHQRRVASAAAVPRAPASVPARPGNGARADHAPVVQADCVGRHIADVLPQDVAARMLEQMHAVLDTQHVRSVEYALQRDGQSEHFEARLVATSPDEVLGLVRDISERKRTEEQIRRLAYCDSLTGIPNRQAFLETLERELHRSKVGNKKFAVLFMDLDAFKRVNDTLGHDVGDHLLQIVSERLRETTRPSDLVSRGDQPHEDDTGAGSAPGWPAHHANLHGASHTQAPARPADAAHNLARLGGDEFTILIPDLERVEHALNVAHRVKEAMRRPFLIDGHEIFVTASIGISLFPEDGDDCSSLLKFADTAMYHAKNCGKNNAQLYSSSLTMKIMRHVKLEVGLRKAIQNGELYLLYQPQVEVRTAEIVGVEALVRWRHPERGIISPTEFIPLAEETGLIVPIGEWVLRTACTQAMAWQQQTRRAVRMAVNLSAKQFKDENLSQIVLSALHETGLEPRLLELELTEGTLMDDANATLATLELLRGIGVFLSIDDFGTGYSSMNYLKRFDVRALKIDRSFISGLPQDSENAAITRAIIAMAHGLKMIVVAEGVETGEQLLLLQQYGCDLVQGYHLGHPSPHDAIARMLVKLGLELGQGKNTAIAP
jgi:predicted signal transduction protein with EAL and GGDEF domain/DNA-binding response OmpR family regulator